MEPYSEADPVALLLQLLVGFGNLVGRGPHLQAGGGRHGLNEFCLLVGRTSKARKGSSLGVVLSLLEKVDHDWSKEHVVHGLSSGEGLIWAVRDPVEKEQFVKEKGRTVGSETVVADPGVEDKRVLVVEEEVARVLKVVVRDGNVLSPVLRTAWDHGDLRILTRNSPVTATGAHVSLVGHVTRDELLRRLGEDETNNGYLNRHLLACVKRSKCLPDGEPPPGDLLEDLAGPLREAVEFSREGPQLRRDEEATAIWHEVYPSLSEGRPGLVGAATARGEAHAVRLAAIYALADRSPVVRKEHLLAALAVADFSEQSARYVFGDLLGDKTADALLRFLRAAPDGMNRTQLHDAMGRHVSASELTRALGVLAETGKARMVQEPTGGRPRERWEAVS